MQLIHCFYTYQQLYPTIFYAIIKPQQTETPEEPPVFLH